MAPDNQSPAEPMPEPALLALARKNFGKLSPAEEELFRAAQEGRVASALTGDLEGDNQANAGNWNPERVVRAECVSWVCTHPQASALMAHRGLYLHGMRIDGELNLGNAEMKFPFTAWKCAFLGEIYLREAQLQRFYLLDCQIESLDAGRATINGSVYLRGQGFKAEGEVNLEGIRIGGDLDCSGAHFSNASGFALIASRARIEGSVVLRRGFKAEGEVNLLRTAIGEDLDCASAQFFNAGGLALTARDAKIEGAVLLRDGVQVKGEVNLAGITIGGSLDCDGAQFSNPGGLALNADGAQIERTVFFRDGFKAEGEVNLFSAKIGRNLDCDGAQLSNVYGFALNADGVKIEGHAFLRQGFQAQGLVNLVGATIGSLQIREVSRADQMTLDLRLTQVGTFWDDEQSWPKEGNLFLDGFQYERLYERAPLQADSRKRWLSLQPHERFLSQPFDQLSSVLRKMGYEKSAWQIFVAKDPERARYTQVFSAQWWWYGVFGKLIGYGYRPGRAFGLSLAMIALGTILFAFGSAYRLISPTNDKAFAKAANGQVIIEKGRQKILETYPVFNAFVYSFESFIPLLKLDQSANWTPNANHGAKYSLLPFWSPRSGSLLRGYLYFHIAAGWLLTSLWVGAVTGLVKT